MTSIQPSSGSRTTAPPLANSLPPKGSGATPSRRVCTPTAPESPLPPPGETPLDRYDWLRAVASWCNHLSAVPRKDFISQSARDAVDRLPDQIAQGPPILEELNELDSYTLCYLAELQRTAQESGSGNSYDPDTVFAGHHTKIVEIRTTFSAHLDDKTPVLLVGERGVGKGQLIRAVCKQWNLDAHFTVSLAATSESLIDSELFGHVRGSFTGAHTNRRGIFSVASDQSRLIYLDDIGECPPCIQSKLLTVLDDGVFRPVGSDETISIGRGENRRFRLFTSTQPTSIAKIREDLVDRIAGTVVVIPFFFWRISSFNAGIL